ncbi:MAG: tetratricopeptide repeat protein [Anaerolineales bacterium]|nr:tetratricopeptide repeat protein [Anaerolineales bacterium]
MSTIPFFAQLKDRFSEHPWLFLALRQDALVWEALQDTDLGSLAMEILPDQPEQWSPAALSLLALDDAPGLDELRASPLSPQDSRWVPQLEQVYQNWLQSQERPATLAQAGLLALAARERFRLDGSWNNLLVDAGLKSAAGRTVLACLYGMLAEPLALLRGLLLPEDGLPRPDLVAHALFSNPLSRQALDQVLADLLQSVPLERRLALLHEVSLRRPWLAVDPALALLDQQAFVTDSMQQWDGAEISAARIEAGFEWLADVTRRVRMCHIAARPGEAIPLLAETLRATHRLRGHLSAQLAQTIGMVREAGDDGWQDAVQETSLEAWKRAVQLAPDVSLYSAGLVSGLVTGGRLEEASTYLQNLAGEQQRNPHPAFNLAAALVSSRLGEHEAAKAAALAALELLESGQALDLPACIALSSFLLQASMFPQALRAARWGLENYPFSWDLHALSAQAQFNLGDFERAISSVYAALAMEMVVRDSQVARLPEGAYLPGTLRIEAGEWAQPRPILDRQGVRRLLLESLESLGAWETALQERLNLIAEMDAPPLEDLRALANCAMKAGDLATVAQVCGNILQNAPDDATAHFLLAEAAEALGDYQAAVEHFDQVTQLAPERVDAWLALAHAQRLAGQADRALESLRAASQAVPMEADVHLALGEMYLERGAATQALACFRRSAELASSSRTALLLGRTLYSLGHLEQARQVLETAFQAGRVEGREVGSSVDIELAYAYALTLLELGEASQAVSLLKDVVLAQPDDPQRCLDLARGLVQLPDRQNGARRALPLLQRILDMVGAGASDISQDTLALQVNTWSLLAEAYTTTGELNLAMEAYRRALELAPNPGSDRRSRLALGLGQAALRLDQPETAVAALEEALQDEPLNVDVQRALSEAYLASNLAPEAYRAAKTVWDMTPSDIDTLTWFVEQGLRLVDQPGISHLPVHSQVIQALQAAIELAPGRSDLLLLLGELLLQNGEQVAAREAFQQMLIVDDPEHRATTSELCQTARSLREAGDVELAVSLLHRAVDQFSLESTGEPDPGKISLADLHAEMALAYQQAPDPEAALLCLDRALIADGSRPDLYCRRADQLYEMGRFEVALQDLESAAYLDDHNVELRYRMALILRLLGDLPDALGRAEQAISMLTAPHDSRLDQAIYMLAAELAYRMLQPKRALTYLQGSAFQSEAAFRDFKYAALQAELALDLGDELTASQAVIMMRDLAPGQPRYLAARARLSCLRGCLAEGTMLFGEAIKALEAGGTDGASETEQPEDLLSLLAVSRAALESAQWESAVDLAQRLITQAPNEPRPYLELAQVLTARAEAQCLCLDLQIRQRAAGEASLSEAARLEFEHAMQSASQLIGADDSFQRAEVLDGFGDEARQTLALWLSRGRAVFQPQPSNVQALQHAFQSITPEADSLAALVMALRRSSDYPAASMAVQPDGHPLVLMQLALALAEIDLEKALEVASDALERAAMLTSGGWPEIAMLQFLLAHLAYRAGSWAKSLDALQAALLAWPDEARWHFLAAQIYLKSDSCAGLLDPRKAQEHLERAIALEPGNASYHFELGLIYLRDGQVNSAVHALEQASELDPNAGGTWLALAQAQRDLGLLEQAAASADAAIERSADPAQALLLRGEIALRSNNPRGALSRAQAVLRLNPSQPEALYLLARTLKELERPAEALAALERAMPHLEDVFPAQLERVHIVRQAQGLGAGLTALQGLAARYPRRSELLALLSEWLEEAGDVESAVQAARLALQENQENLADVQRASLHYRIGLSTRQAGHLDQAIHHLSAAVELEPACLEPYLELGQVYQERREHQQALKVYRKAIQAAGSDYRPYYQAGLVLKDSKDYPAAEAMLRRAALLAPDDVGLHRLLAAVVALSFVHNRRMQPPVD